MSNTKNMVIDQLNEKQQAIQHLTDLMATICGYYYKGRTQDSALRIHEGSCGGISIDLYNFEGDGKPVCEGLKPCTVTYDDGNESMEYTNLFSLQGNRILHTVNNGKLSHLSPRLAAEYGLRCLQELPRRIADWQRWIADNNTTIRQLAELLKQTWSKEDELRRAKADLAKLDRKINAEMNGKSGSKGSSEEGNTSDGGLKQAA